jgi:hypothetical protein
MNWPVAAIEFEFALQKDNELEVKSYLDILIAKHQ